MLEIVSWMCKYVFKYSYKQNFTNINLCYFFESIDAAYTNYLVKNYYKKLLQMAHLKRLDQYYYNLINKTLTQSVDLKPNSWDDQDMYHLPIPSCTVLFSWQFEWIC